MRREPRWMHRSNICTQRSVRTTKTLHFNKNE